MADAYLFRQNVSDSHVNVWVHFVWVHICVQILAFVGVFGLTNHVHSSPKISTEKSSLEQDSSISPWLSQWLAYTYCLSSHLQRIIIFYINDI